MPPRRGSTPRSKQRGKAHDRRAQPARPAHHTESANAAIGHAHGWALFARSRLLDQLERLVTEVESERRRHPDRPPTSANAKVLAAIAHLVLDRIPQDPTRAEYRQGVTLGSARKHWFRAKFGNGRFRLFFRFRSDARIIVFAWVNDQDTLRTYGSRIDAYAVFARMLDAGNPPDTWDELLTAAMSARTVAHTSSVAKHLRR